MEILNQGLTLMTYGISTVFVFLCLLIAAMTLMSTILSKIPEDVPANEPENNSGTVNPAIDNNLLQVLQAAVAEHRNRKSV